jgi:signal transduction histidine kinase
LPRDSRYLSSVAAAPPPTERSLSLGRTLVVPGLCITLLELVVVVLPLAVLFGPNDEQRRVVVRAAGPVLGGALVVWGAALAAWLAPVARALAAKRRDQLPDEETSAAAYRALGLLPLRALWLRVGLWMAVAAVIGVLLVRYSDWTYSRVATLVSVVGLHATCASVVRAAWTARLVARLRGPLYPSVAPLSQLADRLLRRIVLIALLVGAAALAAQSGFIYYFLPIKPEQYLELQSFLPVTILITTVAWLFWARRAVAPVERYLRWQLAGGGAEVDDPRVVSAYRGAQSLSYRLAGTRLLSWVLANAAVALVARFVLHVDADNAILFFAAALVIHVGAALYEAIWHRETTRPILAYIASRHRLPVRAVPALSLRVKLLISFGGLVLFACGLSLFWAFIQYKTLATTYLGRQAEITLDWVRSEVQGRAGQDKVAPSQELVARVLGDAAASSPEGAVFYFLPSGARRSHGVGGGSYGAPRLPWTALARMRAYPRGGLELEALNLAGTFQRLDVVWAGQRLDLGSVAVLYPGYQGRGPGIQRPLKELLVFFLVLFGVCAGIVVLTVQEFVDPIRRLEQRADEMARGELARSVTSGGEGDEVGRLTFALEEMRRALRDKIRSTEEVNLDLEREVQRRTADLKRAQSQLVQAEKMASIGQLVAGIAHEINNPVSAIVNTVEPLLEELSIITNGGPPELVNESLREVDKMVRTIQSGAGRTKTIVQALHNYSRTDDERLVDFDLNRGLDDSLEILRHQLKGQVAVTRRYEEVGRIRGHAGQLNQVFMNLLTNAAQAVAGRAGARVDVVTRRPERGGQVVIEVIDNGPGIPPEILPKIFDPFFTTKEVGQGSGLGLSIVHGIVERHGGNIEVDTEVGRGTAFRVTLPTGLDKLNRS